MCFVSDSRHCRIALFLDIVECGKCCQSEASVGSRPGSLASTLVERSGDSTPSGLEGPLILDVLGLWRARPG